MVKHFEDGNLEKEELTAHVSTLVYALLSNPTQPVNV